MKRKSIFFIGILVGALICSVELPTILKKHDLLERSNTKVIQISAPIPRPSKRPVHPYWSI